ncbi:Striatin Pro11 [Ceratocystis platani]|uniref:Striatin Pro11 n=1 Tax=Ceratocystis fimbriata f. sp. platani TaxID=88771 RepID=A0A0F8D802_CERFI|nr:Striatin Pro11 [Ceratocystis platani]
MGSNVGNSINTGGDVGGIAGVRPFATEYTLQGQLLYFIRYICHSCVMRFLQTEWHRHERERNTWEIERQELKSRIATLEGQGRRSDVTQNALKKYVGILEKKIKAQAAILEEKGKLGPDHANENETSAVVLDRAARRTAILEAKLKGPSPQPPEPSALDDEPLRVDVKSILDQCQAEFTYLMVTPANPPAPRESPPLPLGEGDAEAFNMPLSYSGIDGSQQQQQHQQQQLLQQQHRQQQQQQQSHQSQPSISMAQRYQQQQQHQQQQQQQQQQQHQQHQQQQHAQSVNGGPPNWKSNDIEAPLMMRSNQQSSNWNSQSTQAHDTQSQNHSATSSDSEKKSEANDGWVFPESSPNHQAARMSSAPSNAVTGSFKLRYGLRGHLNTVRTVIFSGGGSPAEPEICTGGDDGLVKRFNVPQLNVFAGNVVAETDVSASFTHRGHSGAVLSLAAWSSSPNFSTGGRALGDGWIFSGGQDSTIRVWERGRVDPKATIEGHADAVWAINGGADRIVLVTGAADGSVKVWSVSPPPHPTSSKAGSTSFVVAYSNSAVLVFDTCTGEQVGACASQETHDGTVSTSLNTVVATTTGLSHQTSHNGEEESGAGATGSRTSAGSGVEGVIITGHEDRFVRFYDANSGQCTYSMWAHPTAVSSLSLSPDGRELVSAGHDASLRFWNLEKRSCVQEITSHRIMRGEGICSVIWSQDGKWVVSGGGDGVVKVFAR